MRSAQGLLLLCLLVGLIVVVTAASAQLRDLEDSLRENERRATMAEVARAGGREVALARDSIDRGLPTRQLCEGRPPHPTGAARRGARV